MAGRALLALIILAGVGCGRISTPAGRSTSPQVAALTDPLIAHEEYIGECMRERGFDYIVALPAEAYFEIEAIEAEKEGRPENLDITVPPDPNAGYVEGLDATTREAYEDAFWGDLDRGGTDEGCYASTYELAWGDLNLAQEVDQDVVGPTTTVNSEALLGIEKARDDFVACMREAGFNGVVTPDQTFDYLEEERRLAKQAGTESQYISWEAELLDTYDICYEPVAEAYIAADAG